MVAGGAQQTFPMKGQSQGWIRGGRAMAEDADIVTVREAAQRTGVTRARMHSWIRRGALPVQQGPYGYLVSCSAVRALAAASVHAVHKQVDTDTYVLGLEAQGVDEDAAVALELHAGQCSLHDPGLLHGSAAN